MSTCSSDGSGMRDDGQDHLLLNHLILGKVFAHLRGKDLMACRLVCKTWNMATIPFTRKAINVCFNRYTPCSKTPTRIQNLIECFRSNKLGIPFGRFTLESFSGTHDEVCDQFLKIFGPTTLCIVFIGREYFSVEDVSQLLRSTPKLETLRIPNHMRTCSVNIVQLFPEDSKPRLRSLKTLIVDGDFPVERDEFCPTFLEELITAAENISCLYLHDSRPDSRRTDGSYYGRSSSLQVLILIEKLGRESTIQELAIIDMKREESELIEQLLKMSRKPNGLNLKKFVYSVGYAKPYDMDHTLLTLVSHFNYSLENLKIKPYCSSFIEFKKMDRLIKLSMHLSKDFNSKFVNFSKIFPALRKLKLKQKNYGKELSEFFPESEPCLNVKSFQIYSEQLKLNGFKQMLNIFPDLTKLELKVRLDGTEILRQIWSRLTQLKHLYIHGAVEKMDSLDLVLTGIPTLEIQGIRDALKNIKDMKTGNERRDFIEKLKSQHCRFDSIANLTNLRKLYLGLRDETAVDGDNSYVTDLTGYIGLYSLKHLKHLTVYWCKFSTTCCDILTKDVGLVSSEFYLQH